MVSPFSSCERKEPLCRCADLGSVDPKVAAFGLQNPNLGSPVCVVILDLGFDLLRGIALRHNFHR